MEEYKIDTITMNTIHRDDFDNLMNLEDIYLRHRLEKIIKNNENVNNFNRNATENNIKKTLSLPPELLRKYKL